MSKIVDFGQLAFLVSLYLIFCSSHIFVFWFLVLWSLYVSISFLLAHLALQNVNKYNLMFSEFCDFIAQSDQKQEMG